MRLLERFRPQVDIAQLGELASEGEDIVPLPRPQNEVMALVIFLAQRRGYFAVAEIRIHRGADWKTRDQTPAAENVEHREFFGNSNRRIVECDRVTQHDEARVPGAPRE